MTESNRNIEAVMVPVPAEYTRKAGELVHVAGVLRRQNIEKVQWYEVAALCEALLAAAPRADPPVTDKEIEALRKCVANALRDDSLAPTEEERVAIGSLAADALGKLRAAARAPGREP